MLPCASTRYRTKQVVSISSKHSTNCFGDKDYSAQLGWGVRRILRAEGPLRRLWTGAQGNKDRLGSPNLWLHLRTETRFTLVDWLKDVFGRA